MIHWDYEFDTLSSGISASLPFPLLSTAGPDVVSDVVGASCQAGIEGRPKTGRGEAGVLDKDGPRLSKSAFRDFSSCCSSARD